MAAMAALQSSFTSLSLSSNSFLGQRFSPSLCPPLVKSNDVPCPIVMKESPATTTSKNATTYRSLLPELKRWERKKCKPNSLPVLHKMHVKVGDTVKVISGKEKGKIGEISKIFKHNSTIVVKELNLKTKHMKSKQEGEPGQILKIEAPMHSSNVMLYSKDQNVASRVGHKELDDGTRVRYLIKTGEIIDSVEKWKKLKEKEQTEVAVAA